MNGTSEDNLANKIATFRPILYRMALLQLSDKALAEDTTQDTIVAALESQRSFEGRSSVRTWLISILRFKILDAIRAKKRAGPSMDPQALSNELDLTPFQSLFDDTGCWATPKDAWTDPQTNIERIEFFRILDACLGKLPATTSRVFLMREWLELSSKEVCSQAKITPGNLRVLLYRARMQLRQCLDANWDRSK